MRELPIEEVTKQQTRESRGLRWFGRELLIDVVQRRRSRGSKGWCRAAERHSSVTGDRLALIHERLNAETEEQSQGYVADYILYQIAISAYTFLPGHRPSPPHTNLNSHRLDEIENSR